MAGPPMPPAARHRPGFDFQLDDKRQLLAMAGSLFLVAGVFAPIIRAPIIGTMNYFLNGRGDGTIVLLLAIVSFLAALAHRYRLVLSGGIAALGVVAFTFVTVQVRLSRRQSRMSRELAGNPFRELADVASGTIQLDWGWSILLLGAALVIVSSLMRDEGRAGAWRDEPVAAASSTPRRRGGRTPRSQLIVGGVLWTVAGVGVVAVGTVMYRMVAEGPPGPSLFDGDTARRQHLASTSPRPRPTPSVSPAR